MVYEMLNYRKCIKNTQNHFDGERVTAFDGGWRGGGGYPGKIFERPCRIHSSHRHIVIIQIAC